MLTSLALCGRAEPDQKGRTDSGGEAFFRLWVFTVQWDAGAVTYLGRFGPFVTGTCKPPLPG